MTKIYNPSFSYMEITDDFDERISVEWWSGSMSGLRSDEEARKGKTLFCKVLGSEQKQVEGTDITHTHHVSTSTETPSLLNPLSEVNFW